MPINIGAYPEELQKMMAQMQSGGGSKQPYDNMSVGGGNVVGGQAEQSGTDYTNAMKEGHDTSLNRFLYGMDQYGEGLPGGFQEGMALEEFGQMSMENMGMGGVDPRGMHPGNFFDDPFAL